MKLSYSSITIFTVCVFLSGVQHANAGARDRIIDPETSYLDERQAYLAKYKNKNIQYEDEQNVYLRTYQTNNDGFKTGQAAYLTQYNDANNRYKENGRSYLTSYQEYNQKMEGQQKVLLQDSNSRHRKYLEIDMPGPPLYFPHDD